MSDSSVVIPFEGGLDMVTPVQETAPGTLVNCLNYEVAPIKGYRRIDGYERFDGGMDGGVSTIYRTELETVDPDAFINVGNKVVKDGDVIAHIVAVDGDVVLYVPTQPGNRLNVGDENVQLINQFNPLDVTPVIVVAPTQDYRDVAPSADVFYSTVRQAQWFFRDYVEEAPREIAGVYHGRDVAFAVADLLVLNMIEASGTLSVGQYVRMDTNSYRVVATVPGEGAHLALVRTGLSPVTNVHVVRRSTAFTGTGTALSVITGVSLNFEAEGRYAQPFVVDDGFTPIDVIRAVAFSDATTAFPQDVRLYDGGTMWGQYRVVGYTINSGGFDTGDASGFLYIADLGTSALDFDGTFSGAYTITDTSMVDLADADYMINALWPGTRALRGLVTGEEQTFYQWGTYNFKATRQHEMVFCTTGKGRAGFITKLNNGLYYYGSIITNADADTVAAVEDDRPKYLAFHAGQRLALGFENGSLRLSAVANPTNFSGFEGAIEIGNGDNITGLLEASGDSTIVFGPRTIRRLVGEGASLALRTVRSDAGAMDYTCVTVAGTPMYVNQNGICVLEQTSAYGDFKNSAISGNIDPFLTPKIVQDLGTIELGGTVCAFPVRAKNQYRLFIGDGSVISLAITAQGPQPTISNYTPVEGALRVPLAYSSSVDDDGVEYILVVWDNAKALEHYGGEEGWAFPYRIFRLDHGWGFDGWYFPHYIDTAYLFNQDPTFLTVDRAILYGMGYGVATLRIRSSGLDDDFYAGFDETVQDISMPRNAEILFRQLGRVMGNVDTANWGRAIQLRFENIKEMGDLNTEPPHILQSVRLFVQTDGISEN